MLPAGTPVNPMLCPALSVVVTNNSRRCSVGVLCGMGRAVQEGQVRLYKSGTDSETVQVKCCGRFCFICQYMRILFS
jgi:hypothetical protein